MVLGFFFLIKKKVSRAYNRFKQRYGYAPMEKSHMEVLYILLL